MRSQARSSAGAWAVMALVLSTALAAGCGGGSGDPESPFLGRWIQVAPATASTGFTIKCDDPDFAFLADPPDFLIFSTLTFERGVLTDLTETSGNCSPLNYDVMGNVAKPPATDPYLMDAPGCAIPFSIPSSSGQTLRALFVLLPGQDWSFSLLSDKATDGAPQGKLAGAANGHVIVFDTTGAVAAQSSPDCVIGGMDVFERLTRP
jgi:hypothetical protein